jgi:aminoglycoside phosphotransferase family enzyme/predicted kinase
MPHENAAPLHDSERLIHALQSPAAWPHPVDKVQLIETHISWVLLTGPYVYKIKKPVDLGFLDYSTLQRRERFCHEEVRLNRRLAPQFYLGVTPITGSFESPRVGGDGEPIEFAVQMLPFPQEALLSRVLDRGELEPQHIDLLAAEIAELHLHADVMPGDSPAGLPDTIWQPVQTNFEHLADEVPGETAQVARLRDWARSEWERRRTDFLERKANGFVRECHGDLHLGNMFLHKGRVVVFDGIEFNDSFRLIDVFSDAAFAVMDLQDRQQPAFAHRLLNAYLERTGDYAGLVVLPFYLVYRALVRAKVACIRSQQADVNADEKQRLLQELEGYLNLADSCAAPQRPQLFITHGPSGSGKTTLTQPLLERLGAVRIRSDVERKRMHGLPPLDRSSSRLDEGIYAPDVASRVYSRLEELATAVLQAGYSVIVDATFLQRAQREPFRRLAERLQIPFTILNFQAAPETLRARVAERLQQNDDASDATPEVLERQLSTLERPDPDEGRVIAIPGDAQEIDV